MIEPTQREREKCKMVRTRQPSSPEKTTNRESCKRKMCGHEEQSCKQTIVSGALALERESKEATMALADRGA